MRRFRASARLPEAWQELLSGLRLDDLPEAHWSPPPPELERLVAEVAARVSDPRAWTALLAGSAESSAVMAARFHVSRERLRQLQVRAARQVQAASSFQTWASAPARRARSPVVVELPAQARETWPVLISLARSSARPDLHTCALAEGLWALVRLQRGYDLRHRTLPPGRYHQEADAAARMGLPQDVLRAVWPATRVDRTCDGRYVQRQADWPTADWLTAIAGVLAEAGHEVWEERSLFAAVRSLPGAPDVLDGTMRLALRKRPNFERTPVPGVWRWQAASHWPEDDTARDQLADLQSAPEVTMPEGVVIAYSANMREIATIGKVCKIQGNDRAFFPKFTEGVSCDD